MQHYQDIQTEVLWQNKWTEEPQREAENHKIFENKKTAFLNKQ